MEHLPFRTLDPSNVRTYVRVMGNTRRGEDGFKGEYPTPDIDMWEQFYIERGLTPPWKVVWAER